MSDASGYQSTRSDEGDIFIFYKVKKQRTICLVVGVGVVLLGL